MARLPTWLVKPAPLLAAALALLACTAQPPPLAGSTPTPTPAGLSSPETATGWQPKADVAFQRRAVAAAHPLAVQAGMEMLRSGGSALDAAIAAQMMLTLVEPQSSGIGGGAFLMHWDRRQVQAWDGRETAPAAANEGLFLRPDGSPLPFAEAVNSGLSVGVPGVVRMLEQAHRQHGRLPWARLFEPAIRAADEGFPVGPRLHALLQAFPIAQSDPQARAYFFQPEPDAAGRWQPWPVGHRLRNPALAEVLRRIASQGSAALYQGPLAQELVDRVQHHPGRPGRMALADLAAYQPVQRRPICTDWKAIYRVCGFPPPSSGHLAMMQMLGLLEALPPLPEPALEAKGLPGAPWLHRYIEVSRLAFADRAQHVADPAFVAAPGGRWESLLEPGYLRTRAALIGPRSRGVATAGDPAILGQPVAWAPQAEQIEHGTSHLSVMDEQGHAVAMTTTIENGFGNGMMVGKSTGLAGGFLLNNQLTDFAWVPRDAQGRPVANRVEPGKRPRSSMSPTLVFDRRDGRLLMNLGSPGGAAIVHYTAKTLVGTLDWGLSPQQAINLPNVVNLNTANTALETSADGQAGPRFPAATVQALRALGHGVQEMELNSGIQALARRGSGWLGGADPRREGLVAAD